MRKASKQAQRAPSSWRRGIGLAGGAPLRGQPTSGRRCRESLAPHGAVPAPAPLRGAPPAKPIPCSILSRIEHGIGYRSRVARGGGLVPAPRRSLLHLTPPQMIFPVCQKPSLAATAGDLGQAPRSSRTGQARALTVPTEPRPLPAGWILDRYGHRPAERPLFRQNSPAAGGPCRPRPCRPLGRRRCSARHRPTMPHETRCRRPGATEALSQESPSPCLTHTLHGVADTATNSTSFWSGNAPAAPAGSCCAAGVNTSPATTTRTPRTSAPSNCCVKSPAIPTRTLCLSSSTATVAPDRLPSSRRSRPPIARRHDVDPAVDTWAHGLSVSHAPRYLPRDRHPEHRPPPHDAGRSGSGLARRPPPC